LENQRKWPRGHSLRTTLGTLQGENAVRVLVTGATGFIGSAVCARLTAAGHDVVAVTRRRDVCMGSLSGVQWVVLDMSHATTLEAWVSHLVGVDAAVNCAGVLQDGLGDSTAGVHVAGATALFAALERAGIRRVIHISALGIDRSTVTAFSASKLAGDKALMATTLDWVILRPSVVVGDAAYGGSALLRGLAALPFLPGMPGSGLLQIVQLRDLVDTVLIFLRPGAHARLVLEVCGPEPAPFTDVLRAYRRWLGLKQARVVPVPDWLVGMISRFGDFLGRLGWRSPVRTTARLELAQGSTGNPELWTKITGIMPKSLTQALAETPASVQERWFARLYFVKPLLFVVLSLFWLLTGLVALGPAWGAGLALLEQAGVAAAIGPPLAAGSAIADIIIGVGIAFRTTTKPALYASLGLATTYLLVATILAPGLWADPLGPLLKIMPVMVLSLVALAIADDR
jgi:uncharacterized protein YbjT (DUF2867 family)